MNKQLQKIQSELNVPKSHTNKFGGYNYRNLEDIFEAVKPLLDKYQANLDVSDDIVSIDGRFYVRATATFESEDGVKKVYGYAREEDEKKGMAAAQITGATSSYARKYALGGLFLLDDNKDADATNTHGKGNAALVSECKDLLNKASAKFGEKWVYRTVEELVARGANEYKSFNFDELKLVIEHIKQELE